MANLSDVLQAQCRRSHGGLWYETYAEFRDALTLLLTDADLARRLGRAGQAFVRANYGWARVESAFRTFVERVAGVTRTCNPVAARAFLGT